MFFCSWNLYFFAVLREHINCDVPVGCGLLNSGYNNGYFPDGVSPIAGVNFIEDNVSGFVSFMAASQ